MANDLKDLRRSAVVSTYGPGAVVDFRSENAPVSGVVAGLEEWDRSFPPAGMANPQRIHEERLQKKLGVLGFRLPPVISDRKNRDEPPDTRRLVAVRFPEWLQCPSCDRISPAGRWANDLGKAYRYCGPCTNRTPGGAKIYVIPVRFVLACERGHLDEFPWDWWVGHKPDCRNRNKSLLLRSEGPGLAGLILSCESCGERRPMDGIFSKQVWTRFSRCSGKRPWLCDADEGCDRHPVAVQRGASNLYFPVTESALSIPPWTDRMQEMLGTWWSTLAGIEDPAFRMRYIEVTPDLKQALDELGMTPDQLAEAIERRLRHYNQIDTDDLRPAEYRQFLEDPGNRTDREQEFEIRRETIPASLTPWIASVVRAVRLREVRAITGFTRIHPPGDAETVSSLSSVKLPWLPAIEVRGEGIFLALNEKRLSEWERRPSVIARTASCVAQQRRDWEARTGGNGDPPFELTSRYMLCHTFAHALMRQLTLECGYSAASLNERIYASAGDTPMAGILIYTATADADGTLGGLQRQGRTERFEGIVRRAVQALEWCSSDPLCITDMMGALSSYSHSACHACVLAPETSCETFNHYLDRGFLTGIPGEPETGFFSELIKAS